MVVLTIILMLWRNSPTPSYRSRTLYVCICNGITEHDIRSAVEAGCASLSELTMRTGAGACCGSCIDTASALLEAARPAPAAPVTPLPLLHAA